MRTIAIVIIISFNQCVGVSLRQQLEHIENAHAESNGVRYAKPSRRSSFYQFDPREVSSIVGVPSMPNHLPEAEAILPGHTLIHPSLGMLKSAVKFPHRELEDGSGVYGNIENLGIRYDAKNERVLYSGFRRSPSDYIMENKDFKNQLMKALAELNFGHKGKTKIFIAALNKDESSYETPKTHHSNIENNNFMGSDTSKFYKGYDGRLKRFVPVHSKHLYNFRDTNEHYDKAILRNEQEDILNPSSADITSIEEVLTTKKNIEVESSVTENWLKAHKNFNHIQINENAPEYSKLIPKESKEKTREWWFYSQHDFKEFSGERKL